MLFRGTFFLTISITLAFAQMDTLQNMGAALVKNLLKFLPASPRQADISDEIDMRQGYYTGHYGSKKRQDDLGEEEASKRNEDLDEAARKRSDRLRKRLEELARKREESLEASRRSDDLHEEEASKRNEDLTEAARRRSNRMRKRLEELARKREEALEAEQRTDDLDGAMRKRRAPFRRMRLRQDPVIEDTDIVLGKLKRRQQELGELRDEDLEDAPDSIETDIVDGRIM